MTNKYSGRLFTVEAGQVVIVSGKTCENAERLDIELTSFEKPQEFTDGDIHFHLSARFGAANEVVRNACTRGVGWGPEERHENLFPNNVANPLRPGSDFKVAIYIDASMFFISINEKPFCMFPHRKPLHEIRRININHDLERIYQVHQITAQRPQWPRLGQPSFSSLVPKEFGAGDTIVLTAVPRGNRRNFTFDLLEHGTKRVLFRLRPCIGKVTITMNDQDVNGRWRQQLDCQPDPFPFIMEQSFELRIAFSNECISTSLNGNALTEFPYRDGAQRIFGKATGFKIEHHNGLQLEIQGVEYIRVSDKVPELMVPIV